MADHTNCCPFHPNADRITIARLGSVCRPCFITWLMGKPEGANVWAYCALRRSDPDMLEMRPFRVLGRATRRGPMRGYA